MAVLVGEHAATNETSRSRHVSERRFWAEVSVDTAIAATSSGWTVFHLGRLLSKCKRLCSTQLRPLLHSAKSAFASIFMFLG